MGPIDQQLEALQAERKALVGSWAYAFAMGHGCSIGDHPQFANVRRHAADLAARIAELGGDSRPV